MKNVFLSPDEALLAGERSVGGKARQLAWLQARGYSVPRWVVLPVEQTQVVLAQIGTCGSETSGPEALAELRRRIESLPLPKMWVGELESMLKSASTTYFAVRSSVVGEDAIGASFAGQMDSFLFRRGIDDVGQAILACLASAFSDRAMAYRREKSLPMDDIRAAVILQIMVEGEVSGVLFTAHPVSGSRSHALLTACYGLGEGVVSGLCDTDEFTVGLEDDLVQADIRRKDVQVVFDRQLGSGTREASVHEELRAKPCLPVERVHEIVRLGLRMADELGAPQDVEWTLRGDELCVLQVRPITALPLPKEGGPRIVWDNSNIQESYCGVTTPLTYTFASMAYATVYEQTMRAMGQSNEAIRRQQHVFDNLLGLIRGRIYYNINNWYRGLLLLPSFRTNKQDMERMMGLEDPVDFVEGQRLTLAEKLRRAPRMALTLGRLLHRFRGIDRQVGVFRKHFREVYDGIDRSRLHRMTVSDLIGLTHSLRADLLRRWETPIINDFFVMMMSGRLRRVLEKVDAEHAGAHYNDLLAGEEGLESVEPTRRLLMLADEIRDRPTIAELFDRIDDADMLEALRETDPVVHRQCIDYISHYGDRCMGELKLETVSARQDPSFIFACVRNFLRRPDLGAAMLHRREADLRVRAEADAFKLVREILGRRGLARFKRNLGALRSGIRHRESLRMDRTRMFGLFRDIYLEIGTQLAAAAALAEPRDVFYLTVDEIDRLVEGRAVQTDLKSLCASRKAEYGRYEDADLPHHFVTEGLPYFRSDYTYPHAAPPTPGRECALKGTGCFPGIVRAPVRLIFSPRDELSLDGEILCTVRTDPGWAPLFPTAAGLLIERGSTLSHSAVVARELGIPAIVGIPGITTILRNGEVVTMDGTTGRIER
jgi:rifampicin phosphotransferase